MLDDALPDPDRECRMNGFAFSSGNESQKAVRMMKCQQTRADRLFAKTVIDGFRVPARARALMC